MTQFQKSQSLIIQARRPAALLALLALSAGLAAPAARPGEVSGTVLDTRRRPMPGALIWVLPSVTTGLVKATTDAGGRYRVTALPNVPYATTAWAKVPYRGETFCVRLAAESPAQYAPFAGRDGAVRNFRWTLSGPVPDSDSSTTFFGAEVRVMTAAVDDGEQLVPLAESRVEFTLTPTGPLIDGSAGKTITRTTRAGENMLYDIPLGHYAVTAVEIGAGGARRPLLVGREYFGGQARTGQLAFKPWSDLCGGRPGSGSFIDRAFLYVSRPR